MAADTNQEAGGRGGRKPMSAKALGNMSIDDANVLYWYDKPIVTKSRLDLSPIQAFIAVLVAIATIMGGLGGFIQGVSSGHDLGCKQQWWSEGCPITGGHTPDPEGAEAPALP